MCIRTNRSLTLNSQNLILHTVISGGQTGVDRAALDAAVKLGFTIGGWCPRGGKAEDGAIPQKYPLTETPKSYSIQRTQWNIRDSDATLIINIGELTGGTKRTMEIASELNKPCLTIQVDASYSVSAIRSWLSRHKVEVLNVAGPRESKCPGIGVKTEKLIEKILI